MQEMYTITIDYINEDGIVYRTFYEPFYFESLSDALDYMQYLKKFYQGYMYVEEDENLYKHPATGESRRPRINLMAKKVNNALSEELRKGEECPNTMN